MTSSGTTVAGAPSLREADARRVIDAIDPDETISFLRDLVRCPTVNPPGDVRAAIDVCERVLRNAGLRCRTVAIDDTKPNLLAELGSGDGPTLCFNAHVDVVPTGEESAWTHPPFGAQLVDGRVYGRGAGDDKASVTAQVMAAVALARSGVKLRGTLVVNEVADEEIGGPAGTHLVVTGGHVKPDFVIVGEQTLNHVLLGEKGTAGLTITVFGRAAHGALPWEGANAVEGMARVIVALQDRFWPQLNQRTHPYFHHSSASINMISGGVKGNVVADRCQIYVDRRLVPGEDPAATVAETETIVNEAIERIPGLRVEVRPNPEIRPASLTEPSSPLVQAMLSANRYLGFAEELRGFSMASDGRFFAEAGYPTIIYGPGDPSLAHVPDECVGIDEVLDATKAYALGALALLGTA